MARTTMTTALAMALAGCAMAGSGVSGPADAWTKTIRTATSITPAERQQSAEAHPQLPQESGGAYAGPQAAYVTRLGQTTAATSALGTPSAELAVTRLNSPGPPHIPRPPRHRHSPLTPTRTQ